MMDQANLGQAQGCYMAVLCGSDILQINIHKIWSLEKLYVWQDQNILFLAQGTDQKNTIK